MNYYLSHEITFSIQSHIKSQNLNHLNTIPTPYSNKYSNSTSACFSIVLSFSTIQSVCIISIQTYKSFIIKSFKIYVLLQ